ncbi:cardiolipin synthase [Galbitalea soli]|uniref:Cardiolipin synthase n=1 Tax=Galbitalea soli TaxID=1268042 RepID=A0A7C9PMR3_9MICO|nr:cardiolipin synthase [Galbitalea soli]NEM90928.1 cardiolipin synthase [Galbitalea soli]NYJ29614.1 cardiolipin synthase [Galbitalea soli]
MSFTLPPGTPTAIAILFYVVIFVVAVAITPAGRRPSSALAWILVMLVLPLVGFALFALIGSPKLPAARREKQRSVDDRIEEHTREVPDFEGGPEAPDWLPAIAKLNRQSGGLPMIDGNRARLLPHFDEQLEAIIRAVDSAVVTVQVEFYIFALDETTRPFFAALERAVQRDVDVRVLLDHIGSRAYPGFRPALAEFTRIGVKWELMLPVLPLRGKYQRPDLRNHRKILVVDGRLAFVGSLNLIDPSYEKRGNIRRGLRWRDLLVELRGPIVNEVRAVFSTDWYSETDEIPPFRQLDATTDDGNPATMLAQIVPSGPGFEFENNLALFTSLLYAAERRVSITSPYFVPEESLLAAIVTAARRGVDIELFVGEIGDQFFVFHAQHSYYQDLLEAGVRIYEYREPIILHAKHISVDDHVSAVGSSNMDIRSFQLDLELMVLVSDREFTDSLRRVEDEYRAESTELTLDDWNRRGRGHRFVDNVARLSSAVQ